MAAPEQPAAAPPSDLSGVNVVETPTSPSSAFTLSRFEFETGTKGNEGTKILMVEWDAAAAAEAAGRGRGAAAGTADDWDVRWEGKEALPVLPIRDGDAPAGSLRVYFLVPPGAPIPTLVTIARRRPGGPSSAAAGEEGQGGEELRARPLPAIFPEGLAGAAGGGDKGSRGVLHTVWARKRLGELGAEIAAEMRSNGEGVGLEMALQERQWIVDHFGLEVDTSSAGAIPLAPGGAAGAAAAAARPASPRSPVGGRLGERLRGLKLATSPAELLAAKEGRFFRPPSPMDLRRFTGSRTCTERERVDTRVNMSILRSSQHEETSREENNRLHAGVGRRGPGTRDVWRAGVTGSGDGGRRGGGRACEGRRHGGGPICAADEPSEPGGGEEPLQHAEVLKTKRTSKADGASTLLTGLGPPSSTCAGSSRNISPGAPSPGHPFFQEVPADTQPAGILFGSGPSPSPIAPDFTALVCKPAQLVIYSSTASRYHFPGCRLREAPNQFSALPLSKAQVQDTSPPFVYVKLYLRVICYMLAARVPRRTAPCHWQIGRVAKELRRRSPFNNHFPDDARGAVWSHARRTCHICKTKVSLRPHLHPPTLPSSHLSFLSWRR